MSYQTDRDEFVFLMAKEGMELVHIRKVMMLSATIQRLCTEYCNRDLKQDEFDRLDKCKESITDTCKPYNIIPKFNNDPRGACVKLQVPSGKTNDWGQIGICVSTRM